MSSTASSADGQSAPKYNMLSWRRFHLDCQILSSLIEERIPRADVKGLISIARGERCPEVHTHVLLCCCCVSLCGLGPFPFPEVCLYFVMKSLGVVPPLHSHSQ